MPNQQQQPYQNSNSRDSLNYANSQNNKNIYANGSQTSNLNTTNNTMQNQPPNSLSNNTGKGFFQNNSGQSIPSANNLFNNTGNKTTANNTPNNSFSDLFNKNNG